MDLHLTPTILESLSESEHDWKPEPELGPDPYAIAIEVLEYARKRGLCRDYASETPPLTSIPPPEPDKVDAELRFPEEESLAARTDQVTREKLAVTKDVALLLKGVCSMSQKPDDYPQVDAELKRIRILKMETPLLRADHEHDVRDFGRTAGHIPRAEESRIPFEAIDEEQDEGLQWPSKYFEYSKQYEAKVQGERIAVPKEGVLFLQHALKEKWRLADLEEVMDGNLRDVKRRTVRCITPPLLPLSPPPTPYVPSSPGNQIDPIPDSGDSLAAEREELMKCILRKDALVPPSPEREVSDEMLLDEQQPASDENLPCPIVKRKLADLRVEGPLTPPMFSESPMKKMKSVTWKGDIREFIPEALPSAFESGDSVINDNDDFHVFYKQAAPIVEEVRRKIENEQLSAADTTKRVEVPVMEFEIPLPPWEEFSKTLQGGSPAVSELDSQRTFVGLIESYLQKTTGKWRGISQLERELTWTVFPLEMGRIDFQEKLHGEDNVAKLLDRLRTEEIATSSTDLWKRDGLRILEENEDDEIDSAVLTEDEAELSLESAVRKRKLEFDEETEPRHGRLIGAQVGGLQMKCNERFEVARQSSVPLQQKPPKAKIATGNECLMFGGMFSATKALHKFMETQGKPVPVGPTGNALQSSQLQTAPGGNTLQQPSTSVSAPDPACLAPSLPSLPSVPANLPSSSFVLSASLWRQRTLVKEIKTLYPGAQYVERDFALPHSPAQEVDIVLSPATGLIFTTMQQIKQRALPGHREHSPVKKRLSSLQARYERVVVLISEGLTREVEELGSSRLANSRDQDALEEFKGFANTMDADVPVQYIKGGEVALARTIVQQMAQYGLPHGAKDVGYTKLLEEETNWELLLRRAGLNPFAAQIVIDMLKGPFTVPNLWASTSSSMPDGTGRPIAVRGLAMFIYMSPDERIAKFQAVCGGSRILEKVNHVLEQKWPSAANGFQIL